MVLLRLLVGAGVLAVLLPQGAEVWAQLEEAAVKGIPDPVADAALATLKWAGSVAIAALAVNVGFAVALWTPFGARRPAAVVQLVVDCVLVTALVYITRGSEVSPFAMLFFAPVLAASVLFGAPNGIVTALCATGLLIGVDGIYIGASGGEGAILPVIGIPAPGALEWSWARAGFMAVHGVSFVGVALLGGTLAGRLSRAKLLLDAVLQNLGDGVIAADPSGAVVFANAEAARLLGLPADPPLEGRPLNTLVQDHGPGLPALIAAGSGGPIDVEAAAAGAGATEASCSTVHDDAGRARGVVLLLRDVTLRREVTRARAQATRLREQAEMSAGLAHEIRNPLASIRGAIQPLLEEGGAEPALQRLMELAISESDRLDGIITQFLDFAAMRGPRPRAVPAQQLLDEIALLLRARDLPPDIELETEAPDGYAVWGDADQMRQVLLNLALNGVEAMRAEGGTLVMTAREAPGTPGGSLLQVRDTGPGIPDADLPKLGTPFFSSRPQGTGLGLAVVHRIVGAHGGTVRIESSPGAGTTVTCVLPGREAAA
jgi:signal transduction histidine kinase